MTLGRHAVRELPTSRPSLGPIRSPWEHEPPDDPHGLREKRPANVAGVPGPRLPSDDPAPSWPRPARPRTHAAHTLAKVASALAELSAVALVCVHVVIATLSSPARPGEVFGVARVIAAARPDVPSIDGPWPHKVFSAVVAAWVGSTGALHRHTTALAAVREAMAVAAVAVVLLVWLLVRRLRLAIPTRVATVVLLGFVPTGTALLTGIRPGLLGAVGLLLATALVAGDRIGPTHRVLALLGLGVAVVLVPAALPALLAAIAVLLAQGDLAARLDRGARGAIAVVPAAGAITALVVAAAGPEPWRAWLASASPALAPVPDLSELPLLLAALALTMAALARRWLRAPAIAVATLLGTAMLVEPARADLFTMALPLAAVVALAGAEDRIAGLWAARSAARRRAARTRNTQTQAAVRAAGAVAAAIVAVSLLAAAATQPVDPPRPPAVGDVATWFANEVPGEPVLFVEDGLWPELLRAGVPAVRMRSVSRSATDNAVDWRVTAGDVDRTGALAAGWVPYAVFGTPESRVTVLRRLTTSAEEYLTLSEQARNTRLGFAKDLAVNPQMTLTPQAAAALRAGDVDERLMRVLASMTGWSTFAVADFPIVPGEEGNGLPRRRAVLSTVNDQATRNWLEQQLDPYRPRAVEPLPGGLLVRYAIPDTPR